MFEEQSVLILGAGASASYGYPTGNKLIDEIINAVDQDKFFIPISRSAERGFVLYSDQVPQNTEDEFTHYSPDDLEKLVFLEKNNIVEFDELCEQFSIEYEYLSPSYIGVEGYQLPTKNSNIKLQQTSFNGIAPFAELAKALKQFDPVSIDKFLKDHPSHEPVGKLMIV